MTDNPRLRIGSRIRELRKEKGYSTRKLAELAEITGANVVNIENGKYSVGLDVLSRICKALEADIKIEKVVKNGVRNSLLLAPMPTASTSQILGNNECFEPYTSNIYSRRVLSGEFVVVNKHLLRDLVKIGLWNDTMKNKLIAANGSVQAIPEIPNNLKELYKTAWEIKQKTIIDMSADRGAFICQSQSLNIFMTEPNFAKLTSMHFYSWKAGLKTGMYYLRTKAAADAVKFTVDRQAIAETTPVTQNLEEKPLNYEAYAKEHTDKNKEAAAGFKMSEEEEKYAAMQCSLDNPEGCEMCGS